MSASERKMEKRVAAEMIMTKLRSVPIQTCKIKFIQMWKIFIKINLNSWLRLVCERGGEFIYLSIVQTHLGMLLL